MTSHFVPSEVTTRSTRKDSPTSMRACSGCGTFQTLNTSLFTVATQMSTQQGAFYLVTAKRTTSSWKMDSLKINSGVQESVPKNSKALNDGEDVRIEYIDLNDVIIAKLNL